MKWNVFAAAVCLSACALTSCGSKPASESSAEDYTINASLESVTEAPEAESAPEELIMEETVFETIPETTDAPETTETPETETLPEETEPLTEAEPVWTGRWECVSLTIDGKTYDGEYMGVPLYAMIALELSEDGSVKAMSPMAGSETDADWSEDGGHIIISAGDEKLDAEMKDEKLCMTEDDTVYIFGRVDSFTDFDYDSWFENYDYRKYTDTATDGGE